MKNIAIGSELLGHLSNNSNYKTNLENLFLRRLSIKRMNPSEKKLEIVKLDDRPNIFVHDHQAELRQVIFFDDFTEELKKYTITSAKLRRFAKIISACATDQQCFMHCGKIANTPLPNTKNKVINFGFSMIDGIVVVCFTGITLQWQKHNSLFMEGIKDQGKSLQENVDVMIHKMKHILNWSMPDVNTKKRPANKAKRKKRNHRKKR